MEKEPEIQELGKIKLREFLFLLQLCETEETKMWLALLTAGIEKGIWNGNSSLKEIRNNLLAMKESLEKDLTYLV